MAEGFRRILEQPWWCVMTIGALLLHFWEGLASIAALDALEADLKIVRGWWEVSACGLKRKAD